MKTKFNILSASLVGIVCASIVVPSYAASSVRSLGGSGTYTGTSSVRSNVASSTSGSAVTAARSGSLRVNNSGTTSTRTTNAASLRTPSTRSATSPRLSIGKYLAGYNGNGVVGGGSSTKPVDPGQSGAGSDVDLSGIEADIAQLQADLSELMGATDVRVEYNEETGELIIVHGNDKFSANLVDQNALSDLEDRLNEKISAAGVYVGDEEYISISDDNTVTAIVGALSGNTDGLATTADVKDYAIPKPGDRCVSGSAVCVLSVDTSGNYFWLELVDDAEEFYLPSTNEPVVEPEPTTEVYESDLDGESEFGL